MLDELADRGLDGWRLEHVAERQHQAFVPLVRATKNGHPRQDFQAAARAVTATGVADPLIVEVGCGSGYYSEALQVLLRRRIRYIGVDYASSMIALARRAYPNEPFVTGDACRLPFRARTCDIVFSGVSLMHIPDYPLAVAESVRVSRAWCVFHTVPVMVHRQTTVLRKRAYGEPVIEVIFNQGEIEALFRARGLAIRSVYENIPYDVSSVVGERTWTVTYLCETTAAGPGAE